MAWAGIVRTTTSCTTVATPCGGNVHVAPVGPCERPPRGSSPSGVECSPIGRVRAAHRARVDDAAHRARVD
eukprot:4121442-Prymnesium_polylepis.1